MNNKIKLISVTGIFTAIIYVLTAYLHIPTHTGYTHIGDGAIYLVACLLPFPYAAFAAGVGAILADCLTGFAIWAPASAVIKVITVFFFSSKGQKIISVRNIGALLPSAILCIGGYYIYEALITGNFVAALAGVVGYIIQSVLSSLFFILLATCIDRTGVKKQLGGK